MRFLSVCSGIEAASVALKPLGYAPVLYSEIERFPREVLKHRLRAYDCRRSWQAAFRNGGFTPLWGDFTALRLRHMRRLNIAMPSLLIGGTPCQAFSVAGARKSLADPRGNLTLSFVRLAHALRRDGDLNWLLWENVPGVLSVRDNAFGCLLAGLVGADVALRSPDKRGRWPSAGMASGPLGRVAWRVLNAQHFGLAQRRKRLFLVAGFRDWTDPAAVLFERKGVRGNSAPGGQARQDATARARAGAAPVGGTAVAGCAQLAPTIPSGTGRALGTDFDLDGGLVQVTHALRADGFDASEDGTGRGTPLVPVAFGGNNCGGPIDVAAAVNAKGGSGRMDFESETLIAFSSKDHGADAACDLAPTLRAMSHADSHANAGGQIAIAFALRGREGGSMPEVEGEQVGALRAASGGSSRSYVAFVENSRAELRLEGGDGQITGALKQGGGKPGQSYPAVASPEYGVRRLLPVECEKLQGFPPGWTLVPISSRSSNPSRIRWAADGPRYKSLGNSFPVPVIAWIGQRLLQQTKKEDTNEL